MFYEVILLAAGQGKRMKAGKNKVFLELSGVPLIVKTIKVFDEDPYCKRIIMPINPDEQELFEECLAPYSFTKELVFAQGGRERQDSVHNGLQHLTDDEGIVLVHDGARPFVTIELIRELVSATDDHTAAIPGVRVKDTIKQVENGVVLNTIERSSLWAVHTPQAFPVSLLKEAHAKAAETGLLGTDDASLVEAVGQQVKMVEGDHTNIKITTPEDLYIAESIMKHWNH